MKNFKKLITVLVSILILSTIIIGCGEPKITPEESSNIVLDIIFKGDNSKLDSVGMTQEEFEDIRTEFEDSIISGFNSTGVSIKDETKTNLLNSLVEGMKKVEYESTTVSNDKKTATVEVKIKPLDLKKIKEELTADVKTYVSNNPGMTQSEVLDYTLNKEAELIRNGYIKEEAVSISMTLTNEGNMWIPNDDDFAKIGNVILS